MVAKHCVTSSAQSGSPIFTIYNSDSRFNHDSNGVLWRAVICCDMTPYYTDHWRLLFSLHLIHSSSIMYEKGRLEFHWQNEHAFYNFASWAKLQDCTKSSKVAQSDRRSMHRMVCTAWYAPSTVILWQYALHKNWPLVGAMIVLSQFNIVLGSKAVCVCVQWILYAGFWVYRSPPLSMSYPEELLRAYWRHTKKTVHWVSRSLVSNI